MVSVNNSNTKNFKTDICILCGLAGVLVDPEDELLGPKAAIPNGEPKLRETAVGVLCDTCRHLSGTDDMY